MVRTSRRPWAPVSKEAASPADGRAAPRTPEPARPGDLPRVPGMRRLNRIPPSLTPVKLVFQVQWKQIQQRSHVRTRASFPEKSLRHPHFAPFSQTGEEGCPPPLGGTGLRTRAAARCSEERALGPGARCGGKAARSELAGSLSPETLLNAHLLLFGGGLSSRSAKRHVPSLPHGTGRVGGIVLVED